MRCLLIYPGLAYGWNASLRGEDNANQGLSLISSLLKFHGHDVQLIDGRWLRGWQDMKRSIASTAFDAVLISVLTADFSISKKIAKAVKDMRNEAWVIVGGIHPTLATNECLETQEFDTVFTGEAEVTLPKLLQQNNRYKIVQGEVPESLDDYPFADRRLHPNGETPPHPCMSMPHFSMIATRGCPFDCGFCQPGERTMFGNKIRSRSVENVVSELEYLRDKFQMKSFSMVDDCLTAKPAWVLEFCEAIKPMSLSWACETRADLVCRNESMFQRMADAGCKLVFVGFESGSQRTLDYIGKGTTVSENMEAANILRKCGIKIWGNFILGFPGETRRDMQATAQMVRTIRPDRFSPAIFTPIPRTRLYQECLLNKLLVPTDIKRDPFGGRKVKGVHHHYAEWIIATIQRGMLAGSALWIVTRITAVARCLRFIQRVIMNALISIKK